VTAAAYLIASEERRRAEERVIIRMIASYIGMILLAGFVVWL
jgi:hypothetical protein